MDTETYVPIVDALIFASDAPLGIGRIKQILEEADPAAEITTPGIKSVIEEIHRENRDSHRGFFLQEVAGGYQYRTRPNYAAWVKRLRKGKAFRLTSSTLETLAITAYRQPITRGEIEKIRGVDCGGVVKNLLERGLIKIVGRKNIPGRPFLMGTTKRFLEMFGLERLSDLPSLKDIQDLDDAQLPTILRNAGSGQVFELDDAADDDDCVPAAAVQPADPAADEQADAGDAAGEEAADGAPPPRSGNGDSAREDL